MDQRSICLFLSIKETSAQAIYNEFVTVLGPDAIAYSTATKYLRQRQFPWVPCDPSEEPPIPVIDHVILDALKTQPFSFIRELARLICIPTTTVHRHLTQLLGFVVKHLYWVPHILTDTEKARRPILSKRIMGSSVQSNIRIGSSLSLMMSCGSILTCITSRSGFVLTKNHLKSRSTQFKRRKS
jgi:hypothetical protein